MTILTCQCAGPWIEDKRFKPRMHAKKHRENFHHGDTEKTKKALAANDRESTRMILKDCFSQERPRTWRRGLRRKEFTEYGTSKDPQKSAFIRGLPCLSPRLRVSAVSLPVNKILLPHLLKLLQLLLPALRNASRIFSIHHCVINLAIRKQGEH